MLCFVDLLLIIVIAANKKVIIFSYCFSDGGVT